MDRVNLTSITISRINEYVIIWVKNEMKESVCFSGLQCFYSFWKDFETETKKLEKEIKIK